MTVFLPEWKVEMSLAFVVGSFGYFPFEFEYNRSFCK